MRWALTVLAPPAVEPLSIDEAKLHLRVDTTDEDSRIAALIRAAREDAQESQGRSYVTQQLRLHLEGWPAGRAIYLPRPPLQSVQAVRYVREDGTQQTLDPSCYLVVTASEPGAVVLAPGASWPSEALQPGLPVTIDYTAGYGSSSGDVPERIRQALLLHVGFHWGNRGDGIEPVSLPRAVREAIDRLLDPDRVWFSGPEG